jgi:serine/threonine-protein kinase
VNIFVPNAVLQRKYRIINEIGRGGMGIVYRVEHLIFREEMAIKVMSAEYANDPQLRERFLNEARIIRKLQHANIVHLEGIEETDDGQLFVVMEYVRGSSLASIMSCLSQSRSAKP